VGGGDAYQGRARMFESRQDWTQLTPSQQQQKVRDQDCMLLNDVMQSSKETRGQHAKQGPGATQAPGERNTSQQETSFLRRREPAKAAVAADSATDGELPHACILRLRKQQMDLNRFLLTGASFSLPPSTPPAHRTISLASFARLVHPDAISCDLGLSQLRTRSAVLVPHTLSPLRVPLLRAAG
jgi:hypothetical protein